MRRVFRFPLGPRERARRDVDEEIGFHLESRVEELVVDEGLPRRRAEARARAEFGDVEGARRSLRRRAARRERRRRLSRWSVGLLRDLRHAARRLRGEPGFAAAAALTLAVGVGAATGVFALVDGVLLRPLPHPDADRLVMAWQTIPRYGFTRGPVSYPALLAWREEAAGLESLSGYARDGATLLAGEGGPEHVEGARVTGDLFRTLRAGARLGRTLEDRDDRPGSDPVVVLGHDLWSRRFGRDPAVVGRTVRLGGEAARVVGVMGPEFSFPSEGTGYWAPLRGEMDEEAWDTNRLTAIGRLRAGASADAVEARLDALMDRLARAHPEAVAAENGMRLEGRREYLVGPVRPVLLVLLGAAALLLLTACANLVNLMLARAATRRRELAVRSALGAGRGRLARQLLSESLVLAAVGGALGVALAFGAAEVLRDLGPPDLPRRDAVGVDLRVLGFALAVSLGCALGCGLLPAFRAARRDPREALGGGRARAADGPGGRRLLEGLVVAQVALALALLSGAGLLVHSFHRLTSVRPGFDAEHVLSVRLALPESRYAEPSDVASFYRRLLERLDALPGTEAAGGTWALPFSEDYASTTYVPADRPVPEEEAPVTAVVPVRGDYFRAMGIPLRRGRAFTTADGADAPPVAVVSEGFARRFWGPEGAVGSRIRKPGTEPGSAEPLVVGVVGDVRRRSLAEEPEPTVYLPHDQAVWTGGLYVTVRTSSDPRGHVDAVRRAVRALDPELPIREAATVGSLVSRSVAAPRFRTAVVAGLAGTAGFLAVVGVYGILAFVVAGRRREIALRMAVGAGRGRVLRQVLGRGARVLATGLAAGAVLALAAARSLRTLLFGLEPLDPATHATVIGLLAAAGLAACWLPARRAARIEPMKVLREE